MPVGDAFDGHAVARTLGGVAGELDRGHEVEGVVERDEPLGIRVVDVERPDRGAPQLHAVGVAEVHDQRPHVGAGGAVDVERRPLAVAPAQREALDLHLTLGDVHFLAAPRERVGPLAARP